MQGTRVRTLVQEDSTSLRATKPEPQLLSPSSRACEPQLLKPVWLESMLVKRSHYREKPAHSNQEQPPSQPPHSHRKPKQRRPSATKNKQIMSLKESNTVRVTAKVIPCQCEVKTCYAQLCPTAQLFAAPCMAACQAPVSIEFSRQEYWHGLPFPFLGDLPDPGIKSQVSHIAGRFFTI